MNANHKVAVSIGSIERLKKTAAKELGLSSAYSNGYHHALNDCLAVLTTIMEDVMSVKGQSIEFKQGCLDCLNGITHKDGKGDDYNRGYARQYEEEQRAMHYSELGASNE